MIISYDYYRVFYYVAKYKSFTKAAQVLFANQPNITRTIKNLETALGCSLFLRNNRGVTLTPEGEKLFLRISVAFEQIQLGENELANEQGIVNGIISIGASDTAMSGALLSALDEFHRQYPTVKIKITNFNTLQAMKALKNGVVDISIATTPFEPDNKIKIIKIKAFNDILVGGSSFSFLAEKECNLSELIQYPFISLQKDTMSYKFYSDIFAKQGLTYMPETEIATNWQMIPLVKHNLGIGFIQKFFIANELKKRELVRIHLTQEMPTRYICILERKDIQPNKAIKALKQFIIESNENH